MKLVMAYPAIEEFALSSLGYMNLYKTADNLEGVSAERISTDNCMVNPTEIDALSFSLSFDFDYLGVLEILKKLKIPYYKNERDDSYPFVFAGGPVITTNPAPYEDFFDFMLIGDGENLLESVLTVLNTTDDKTDALNRLKKINGVYIKGHPTGKNTANLNNVICSPVISDKSYFKNTFIIEVARGCMNRCAFCTASYLNLPFRNYEYEQIIQAVETGLQKTNKIALLGAQISAHPKFDDIMSYLRNKIESGRNIELGISSLRTDSVTPNMIKTLVAGGQKHSTIAIEAASKRLRKFINKNLSEEQILKAVKVSRENGLKGLKIYCMTGIPNENEDDIEEFLKLAEKIKEQNRGFNVEFSFSTFVPKPHTPFQWERREDTKSLEIKQKYLEKGLAKLGFKAKFSSPKWDYWQTVLSRSGSEIAPLLVYVYENGGGIGMYKKAVKELGIDMTKPVEGFDVGESLPWDVISVKPGKELLIKEYNRLKKYL